MMPDRLNGFNRIGFSFALSLVLTATVHSESHSKSDREVLDAFTGHWEGTFKVFTHEGILINQLQVRQQYWWDNDVQCGQFIERDREGNIVRADAKNYVKDGKLICQVTKDNGEKSEHRGRYTDDTLFWSRQTPGVVECFRERLAFLL